MKHLLLTLDLEEYEGGGEKGFDMGYEGGRIVKNLLERIDMTATFFVTAEFYEKYPDFVKELSEQHEIAFHGLAHDDDYQVLPPHAAAERLSRGKTLVEKGISCTLEGFRAPRMRPPSYTVLKEVGFLYSSSLHPTYVPGRYNHLQSPRSPFVVEGVVEIPVSVSPGIRLPLSWLWFRQLGLTYAKVITMTLKDYVCIYFHPWEFVSLKGYGGILYTRNTGKPMELALEKFLKWISPHVEPVTMKEFAKKFR